MPLRATFGLLVVQLCLVLTLGACGAASSDAATQAKLRICVADFRPDKNTTLTDRELDYCKVLQRAVEDELVQWYEVEESTRYGSVAKQLANLDSAQAARALGEKAGVHQVVTGLVTKVGSSVVVQCHFVEVPRSEEGSSEKPTNRVLRTVTVSYKVSVEDDWVELMKVLRDKVQASVLGLEPTPPQPTPPEPTPPKPTPPKPRYVDVVCCKATGMSAGPNCKPTVTKSLPEDAIPPQCTFCKASEPVKQLTDDEVQLKIAQALRAIDEAKYADTAKITDDLIKARADKGEVWHIRGVALFFQGKFADAETCFLKAIEVGYDRASVRDDLANTYWILAQKSPNSSKAYMEKSINQAYRSLGLAPGNPWAYNVIGCVTFMTAGKDKAKLKVATDALVKSAELLTSDPQLLDNAANALAQMDDMNKAEAYAKAALSAAARNNEPYPNAYETLSKIYRVKGDKQSAKRYHDLYLSAGGK